MIFRKLPNTDAGRKRVLDKALAKNTSLPAAQKPLTAATAARLSIIQLAFKNGMIARGAALSGQVGATGPEDAAMQLARMFISHFIQVFDFGVARGVYDRAHRAMYQLPVNSSALPPLVTEADIAQWAENLHEGDALRIAAGGAAMANPKIADVDTATADFITKSSTQSGKVTDYDTAQEAVEALRPEADKVIKKIYDETETFYNEETPSSMRRKARAMGVVYESNVKLTFHFNAADSATHAGIAAQVVLDETENTITLAANGKGDMLSTISDEATFVFSHPDYVTQQIVVPLPLDTTEFTVNVDLVHV